MKVLEAMKVTRMEKLSSNDNFLRRLFLIHVSASIVSMFGAMANTIANSIIAGKFFGADGLAVMSVTAPFYSLFAAVGALIGVGGSTLASFALGSDDQDKADEAFTLSVFASVIISAIVAAICLLNLESLLYIAGCTPEVYDAARNYSIIYLIGGFGTAMFYLPYNFFKLTGKLNWLTQLFLSMAALNVVLDLVFINLGMQIEAIALGTVLASVIASLVGIFLLREDFSFHRQISKQAMLSLAKLGSPAASNNLLMSLQLVLLNQIFLAAAGKLGLAILSVILAIENFSAVIIYGLAQATSPFIGVFTKELDTLSVRLIEKYALISGAASMVILTIIIVLFAENICLSFEIHDSAAIEAVKIFAYSLIPTIICLMLFFYYQSAGFTEIANILIFLKTFLLIVLPAYLLIPYGLSAVCWSFMISAVGSMLVLLPLLLRYPPDLTRPLLQDLNAEKNGNYISFSVTANEAEIMNSVEDIEMFCESNNLPQRQAMLVQLSMEEMMVSIAEHSDTKQLDVRILVVDNKIILRIRSGGKMFNPLAYKSSGEDEDDDTIGIKMIRNMTDNISYKSTLGINNLTVVIDYEG